MDYSNLPKARALPDGNVAWSASDLPLLLDYVTEKQWIVLGGDVLTQSGNYTYDNWYYNPESSFALTQNVQKSVAVCLDYVTKYTDRNGCNYLFSVVLSDSFLKGN